MLKQQGEAELKAYTKVNFQETVTNVAPNVWHIASMGPVTPLWWKPATV